MKNLKNINIDAIPDIIINWLTTNAIRLVIGIILLFVGWKIINKIVKSLVKLLRLRHFDETVTRFLETTLDIVLKLVLVITLLGYVGINLAGLATLLASAGLAVGLALQGSLSNLAGGFIILILRPFKVGDYVEVSSKTGTVLKIQIFYTHLLTPDNKEVMIPNGKLANESIINYSSQDLRRVDLTFSIGYDDDLLKAKRILGEITRAHTLIVDYPKTFIAVTAQGASSIDFIVKAWCKNEDYWTVHYDLLEDVKLRFDKEGISIPFNQLDVNLKKAE